MEFDVSSRMFAMMCSIALFEYSINHSKTNPALARYARFLSEELDEVIDKSLKEE